MNRSHYLPNQHPGGMAMNRQKFHPNQQQQIEHSGMPMNQQSFHPHQQQHQIEHGYMSRQLVIEDAIKIARAQVPGEVVSAELERKQGRLIYEVDIVSTQGPVYEVKIDATTGEVLEVELD